MSRHSVLTEEHEVVIGVDRPLNHVFASIFDRFPAEDAESDSTEGFNPFSNYAPSKVGLQTAIHDVETFLAHRQVDFKVPPTMIESLEADLIDLCNAGGKNLNYARTHREVK